MVWVSCIFLFESVGMWTKGAFLCKVFFLFCSLHNFDTKSVDRWTSTLKSLLKELGHLRTITILSSFDRDLRVMRILKKITSVISSFKSVNCVKEAVFLLHVFFLSFKILKKLWTGGQVMKIEKKFVSASCIFLFISVGYVDKFHYLKLCFLFNIFLSFLYP